MKIRGISPSRVSRIVTLLAYSFFVSWLAQEGKLSSIAHPRMHPWIELSGALCLLLAFFQLFRIGRGTGRTDPPNYFVCFAFVIAMTFVFVDSGSFAPGRFSTGDDSLAVESALIARRNDAARAASIAPLPGTITFNDDRYWTLYNRLYDSPDKAAGHRIVVQGFFDEPPGGQGQLGIVGRNMMWCCSADMAVIGFLVRGKDLSGFRKPEWVEASGTLAEAAFDMNGEGKKNIVPIIELDSIKRVDKGATSAVIFPY